MPPGRRAGRHPVTVVFLTLYIDLIGFSILFPLIPDLYAFYLEAGSSGILGDLLRGLESVAGKIGTAAALPAVLFGGLVSSLFSSLQFVFAPFWGMVSDKFGRRPVLLLTVAGTAASYAVWVFSGSLWVFVFSRVLAGIFGGNLSVAAAAIADVTTRENRSRSMGAMGAAFGLGLVTGPVIGAAAAQVQLTAICPALADFGMHPFSAAAAVAFLLSLVNLVWISLKFGETLPAGTERPKETVWMVRNPLRAVLELKDATVRRVNLVTFLHSSAFVAMETTLVFLSAQRFGFSAGRNGILLGFLGICSVVTQGILVRPLLRRLGEAGVLRAGLLLGAAGLLGTGLAPTVFVLYASVLVLAVGAGLVNPSTAGLISLNTSASEQGRVLGIFKSLGALSRAVVPLVAGLLFWTLGGRVLYIAGALISLSAWFAGRSLKQANNH